MRVFLVVLLMALTGCRTSVRWAIRVPKDSRTCVSDCNQAPPDDAQWRACVAACGGEVSEEWCDGTTFRKRDPAGCQEVETSKVSPFWTVVFVAGMVVLGGAVLGGLAARKP